MLDEESVASVGGCFFTTALNCSSACGVTAFKPAAMAMAVAVTIAAGEAVEAAAAVIVEAAVSPPPR